MGQGLWGQGRREGGVQGSEKVLETLETRSSQLLCPATEKPTRAGSVQLDHTSWKEGAACSLA